MSDMFDTYNRVYASNVARQARRNISDAQRIVDAKNERIGELENEVWAFAAGMGAMSETLDEALALLDEKCGGAEHNPLRKESDTKIVIPNGDREGENIQERDRIFLVSLKRIVEKNCPHIGSWKTLIRKYSFI